MAKIIHNDTFLGDTIPIQALLQLFLAFILPVNSLANEPKINTVRLQNLVVTESASPDYSFNDQPYLSNVFVFQDLEEHGINSIQDLAAEIPNLNFLDFGLSSFHSILTTRGLGNTPLYSAPSIIFYVDDVAYGSAFSYANRLVGVESIEVYKGPQGGLFGKNSYGGVINIHTQKPQNQTKTHLSAEYARFNSWSINGYSNGAILKDKLFFSLGGSFAHSDGYMRNTFLNNRPDRTDHFSGHASLIWKPTPLWNISLMAAKDDFNDATPRNSSLKSNDPLSIQSNQNGKLKQGSNTGALRISYKKNGLQFLSVTSRRDWRLDDFFIDSDFSSLPLNSLQGRQRQTQWNQEVRVSLSRTDFNWSVGIFALTEQINRNRTLKISGFSDILFKSRAKEQSIATYTNLIYYLSDKLRFHAGLRFDYVDKQVNRDISITTRFKKDKHFFHASPKISIDYSLSDELVIYSSTGLAFKPGGFSVSATSPTLSEFDSEKLWASELGLKSQWLENRIKVNMAFFYYQIDDYQVEKPSSLLDYTIINANKASSYGVEIETEVELLPGLNIETAFGYTHIRFDKFIDPATNVDLSGNSPPYVPEKNLTIAAQYKHPTGFFFRSEWQWTDRIYFDDTNSTTFKEKPYSTLNARIGYQYADINFYLFGNNLTDSRFYKFIFPPNTGTPNKPRSFGVKLSMSL